MPISHADPRLPERLQTVYDCPAVELPSHLNRFTRLIETFHSRYGHTSNITVVRAPGRVNLIGEHTDYSGYPVLPMTIDRDIALVIAPTNGSDINLINEDSRFPPRTFTLSGTIEPFRQGDWGNYVKAAIQELIREGFVDQEKGRGFNAVVGGTIPGSAGLSSSSALVVASGLAFLAANQVTIETPALAELLARAERYVGMEGGGMDQAISLLGNAGQALTIEFFPLRFTPIPLPPGAAIVVCNSLVQASKSTSAREAYNLRVVECRLAGAMIASSLSKKLGRSVHARILADLTPSVLRCTPEELERTAHETLGTYSLSDIAHRLGEDASEVQRRYCSVKDGSFVEEPPGGFKLLQRYRHVVSEAARVERAAAALSSGSLDEFASLMNESHASCRDDYEVSCDELESLITIARSHGADGARLTGAGFGGCTVNLVPVESVDRFLDGVRREYYETYIKGHDQERFIAVDSWDQAMFVCRATKGAGVL